MMTQSPPADRTLVNAIGIPGFLLIIWLGGIYFTIFMTVVILLALKEFYALFHERGTQASLILGGLASVFFIWFYYFEPYLNMLTFLQISIIFIVIALIRELFNKHQTPSSNLAITFLGIAYVPVLLGTLIALNQIDGTYSTQYTFSVIISIWICDSAAFFFGTKWGKTKIMPSISPNKSVEGSVAGLVGAFIFFAILKQYGLPSSDFSYQDVLIFSIITGVFGQIGDFVESMFKREVGVKDSSTFLMGHGGVLDRFDSLIFAAPLVYFYIRF